MEFLNRKSKLFLEKIRIFLRGFFSQPRKGEREKKRKRERERK